MNIDETATNLLSALARLTLDHGAMEKNAPKTPELSIVPEPCTPPTQLDDMLQENQRLAHELEQAHRENTKLHLETERLQISLLAEQKLRLDQQAEIVGLEQKLASKAGALEEERNMRKQLEQDASQPDEDGASVHELRLEEEVLRLETVELELREELQQEKERVAMLQEGLSTLADEHSQKIDDRVQTVEDTLWRMIAEHEDRLTHEQMHSMSLQQEIDRLSAVLLSHAMRHESSPPRSLSTEDETVEPEPVLSPMSSKEIAIADKRCCAHPFGF